MFKITPAATPSGSRTGETGVFEQGNKATQSRIGRRLAATQAGFWQAGFWQAGLSRQQASPIRQIQPTGQTPSHEGQAKNRGGARRDRTDDLMLAKHALYQLSYGPIQERPAGELSSSLIRCRPSRLGLRHTMWWWAQADSNCRPHAYQACALTS